MVQLKCDQHPAYFGNQAMMMPKNTCMQCWKIHEQVMNQFLNRHGWQARIDLTPFENKAVFGGSGVEKQPTLPAEDPDDPLAGVPPITEIENPTPPQAEIPVMAPEPVPTPPIASSPVPMGDMPPAFNETPAPSDPFPTGPPAPTEPETPPKDKDDAGGLLDLLRDREE